MPYDADQRRHALRAFLTRHRLTTRGLVAAGRLNESSVRHFLAGRARAMGDDTWCELADAAAETLNRPVSAAELRGEERGPLPLWGYAGAGAEIHPFEDQGALDWVEAPPGLGDAACVVVRGDSMLPRYQDGDRLFYRQRALEPHEAVGEECVVQVVDGPILCKRVERGARKNRWHLISINPAVRTLEDQKVAWAARIEWIQRAPPQPRPADGAA